MYKSIVITSGVSIFGYDNIFGELTRAENIFEFDRENPLPPQDKGGEEAIREWVASMKRYFHKIKGNEQNISAEFSMLYALRKNNKLAQSPLIDLLYSESFGGKASAALIQEVLSWEFEAEVNLIEVKDLDVTNRLKLNRGLGDFMSRLNEVLKDKDPQFACFAPIGGYKIFSYFGYVAGSLNNLPTAYLHVDQQVLLEIPPVPISYDTQFILDNMDFLRKLYFYSGNMEELEPQELEVVNNYSHFFDFADNLVDINAFGIFVCEKIFPHVFNIQIFISPKVKDVIEKYPSNKSFIQEQLKTLAQKLKEGRKDPNLFHERELKALSSSDFDFHLYKGASQGENVFRAAWDIDNDKKELYINHIWLDHEKYEKELLKQGQGLKTKKNNFENYSEEVYP